MTKTAREQRLRELVDKWRERAELNSPKWGVHDEYAAGINKASEWAADELAAILAEPVEVSVELTPMSFVTEMWPPDPGGMRSYMPRGVKVTHKPTGITVTCEHERSQHKNRDTAIRALRAALKEPGQ